MVEDDADRWVELHCAQLAADGTEAAGVPVPDTDPDVLSAMAAMARASAALEASLLVSVQDLVLRAGSRLLSERGVTDPGTMSKTAHQTWRVSVKSAVAGELQVLLGVSLWEARQLVALATSPGSIRRPILGALRRGEVIRKLVLAFQQETRRLEVDQAIRVSEAMFGTDEDLAAVERLDVDGNLELGRPWHHREFFAALKREVAKAKSLDEDAAEEEREAAFEGRSAQLDVEDDGTATLTCTMSTVTGVAVFGRIEDMARRARAGGDKRTLAQLRADIIAILILHGVVTLPGDGDGDGGGAGGGMCAAACCGTGGTDGAGEDTTGGSGALFDEVITPEMAEELRALISATPAGQVGVIVPWDAMVGVVCPQCRGPVAVTDPADGDLQPAQGAGQPGVRSGPEPPGEPAIPAAPDFTEPHSGCRDSSPCRQGDSSAQTGPPVRPGAGRVAELVGWEAAFITPRQARRIAVTPGTTLHRLLIDPESGRCIERSNGRYTPDSEMKRQIIAADVYGRGPGSRRPAGQCELDHEKEWLTHGWTAEVNLNPKELVDHVRKTKKLWRSLMNRRRDVTWTTLLGQIARTRGHDYRQYVDRVCALAPWEASDAETSRPDGVHESPGREDLDRAELDRADLAARRDLLNQLVYAALVHRRPGERAEADDDVLGSEEWLMVGDWGHLHHTDDDGQRRPGPAPAQATPEEILGLVDPPESDVAPTAAADVAAPADSDVDTTTDSVAAGEPAAETDTAPETDTATEAGAATEASAATETPDVQSPGRDTPWGRWIGRRATDEPPPF
ncbi:hypothetical protein [Ornithinimicrobium panacihumi]|uniref:hypothetical protein n=1 Tax=Ornithinimicrobium panacihumi TaxID=2008449 RepID=UPI003F896C9B